MRRVRGSATHVLLVVMDAVTGVIACSIWAIASSAIVIERVPIIRSNAIACCLLFLLPGSLLLWATCYARRDLSPPGRAAICALPAVGISLYMRLLLRQGHDWGIPQVSCPGPYVRRWIVSAIAGTALAVGWARVWCYPEGLVASLARSQGVEWYVHWLLSTLSGCSTTLLWWQALQRSSVISRNPSRWKEGWAWWSLPHRQYLLFLLLLLTPLLRVAGHVGALLSDSTSPLVEASPRPPRPHSPAPTQPSSHKPSSHSFSLSVRRRRWASCRRCSPCAP